MSFSERIVRLPLGTGGLNASDNPSSVGPNELVQADTITFDGDTIHKEGGASKFTDSQLTDSGGSPVSIIAGIEYTPSPTVSRQIILTSEGKCLKDDGSAGTFGTSLATGLTVGDAAVFIQGGKEAAGSDTHLFLMTGSDAVQVLDADGTAMADIATPPADWTGTSQPTVGAIHEGRLWGAGNSNDPHRVYYSTTSDHEDFGGTGSGSISVYPGSGAKIVGLASFKGWLVVFKWPQGIYAVDTTAVSDSNWKVRQISTGIGVAGPGAVEVVEDDIYFINQNGFWQSVSAVEAFGSMGSRNLFDAQHMRKFIDEDVNWGGQEEKARIVYNPGRREIHASYVQAGQTDSSLRLVGDLNGDSLRFRPSTRDAPVSLWITGTGGTAEVYMGDDDGHVWVLDQEDRNKDGSGYNSIFRTANTDLGWADKSLSTVRKRGQFLELEAVPRGNWDLTVEVFWDDVLTDTISYNLGTTGAGLGSFVLGTDKLASSVVFNTRRRLFGEGRRISIKCSNEGADQDFAVTGFLLGFGLGTGRTDF